MAKSRYLVSLITQDNDYQREQAASAKAAAQEFGIEAEIVYAGNDAITQSTQLLKAIQADTTLRPQAVIVEPLGATPFPKVASTAAAAGIGWAVVNREADYTAQLRQNHTTPVFSVSVDQVEVGRSQGKQIAAFLPRGGSVLFIQGPSVSSVSRQRLEGHKLQNPASKLEREVDRGERLSERLLVDQTYARAEGSHRPDLRAK